MGKCTDKVGGSRKGIPRCSIVVDLRMIGRVTSPLYNTLPRHVAFAVSLACQYLQISF